MRRHYRIVAALHALGGLAFATTAALYAIDGDWLAASLIGGAAAAYFGMAGGWLYLSRGWPQ